MATTYAPPRPRRQFRRLSVGTGVRVPVAGGGERRFVNLDNAASTPPFRRVLERVNRFTEWYANVHRGTGFKSRFSSWAYEEARDRVRRFVRAPESDTVLFTRGTTGAINHVAGRFPFRKGAVVLVSGMEHHSNDLPWRRAAKVEHIRLLPDGGLDEEHFRKLLQRHRGRVALVAMTGASNVTGRITPIHRYAAWAHEAGASILVDAAQLAPHRPIDMRAGDDPEHLDFLAFSAHKLYAPFGVGVLVGPRRLFEQGDPYEAGGGAVEIVDRARVAWAGLPDREEAGTPCVVGAVALAAAIEVLQEIGWETISRHESALVARALGRLARVPGLAIYGDADPARAAERLGVLSFNLRGRPHGLVAEILGREWAVGTRCGCFCAHIYVKHLLGIGAKDGRALERRIRSGDRSDVPGAVRASISLSTTKEDVDTLGDALEAIAAGRIRGRYRLDPATGDYRAMGETDDFTGYLHA